MVPKIAGVPIYSKYDPAQREKFVPEGVIFLEEIPFRTKLRSEPTASSAGYLTFRVGMTTWRMRVGYDGYPKDGRWFVFEGTEFPISDVTDFEVT